MLANRIGGTITIIFGGIGILEAIRLYSVRMGPHGDHTFPGIVGGVMIFLGLILVFFPKEEHFKVEYPSRDLIINMLLTVGLLFVYWFMLQYLGYVISSFLVAVGLFRVVGSYSFLRSSIFSVILTLILYLIFIYWLMMPFPTGIFGL